MIVSASSVFSTVASFVWHYVWSKGGATAAAVYGAHYVSLKYQVNSAVAQVKATAAQVVADAKGDVSKITAAIAKL